MRKFDDLTGKKFGKLTARFRTTRKAINGKMRSYWTCDCDCGNEIELLKQYLTGKWYPTTHCGCLVIPTDEKTKKLIKLDKADKHLLDKSCWYIAKQGYVRGTVDGKLHLLHRYILGNPEGAVDHINGDKLDNRRSNLRAVPYTINNLNRHHKAKNSTGHIGVIQKGLRFYASICNPRISLGAYDNLEDAIYIRECARDFIMHDYK